ncbi:MAG: DUF971 domain-containing protein [Balneolaceae bacterium]
MNLPSEDSVKPESIEISNREQILELTWSDGHTSVYPLFGLRKNCPCVMCRGGHSEMGKYEMNLFFVKPDRQYEINDIETVGNHALKISWNDGHNTGMYRWELLRAMCPQTYQKKKKD